MPQEENIYKIEEIGEMEEEVEEKYKFTTS